jgi:hypothetical protein
MFKASHRSGSINSIGTSFPDASTGREKIVETKLLSDPEAKGHKLMDIANGGPERLWPHCNTSNIDASQG